MGVGMGAERYRSMGRHKDSWVNVWVGEELDGLVGR